ncbi:MAG: hypothetical protein SF162_11655 [bacterium]|nr:hypothetical protein [bacterium]
MQELRRPFFYAAFIVVVIVVAIEISAAPVLSLVSQVTNQAGQTLTIDEVPPELRADFLAAQAQNPGKFSGLDSPPGIGIQYLIIVDGILLLVMGMMVASQVIPQDTYARLQGFTSCLVSLILVISAIGMIIFAIVALLVMITLFLAVPFGTLIYLALFGFFNRGGAATALTLIMTLKIVYCVLLVLAQQRFLQNRVLVLLSLSSLLCTFIITFLHGIVPIILVSITDNISGICVAICGVIWAVIVLIGAIPAVIKSLGVAS